MRHFSGAVALCIAGVLVASCDGDEEIANLRAEVAYWRDAYSEATNVRESVEEARYDEGFNDGRDRGFREGYRERQTDQCNSLYGVGPPDADGWRRSPDTPDGLPLVKATVLYWHADFENEVPMRITRGMCLR